MKNVLIMGIEPGKKFRNFDDGKLLAIASNWVTAKKKIAEFQDAHPELKIYGVEQK